MIRHYIYFIIYELLDFSNGFFIFLFCLFFFYRMVIIRTHFFSILISVIRKDNGLCFKCILEITKLFHTHTGQL